MGLSTYVVIQLFKSLKIKINFCEMHSLRTMYIDIEFMEYITGTMQRPSAVSIRKMDAKLKEENSKSLKRNKSNDESADSKKFKQAMNQTGIGLVDIFSTNGIHVPHIRQKILSALDFVSIVALKRTCKQIHRFITENALEDQIQFQRSKWQRQKSTIGIKTFPGPISNVKFIDSGNSIICWDKKSVTIFRLANAEKELDLNVPTQYESEILYVNYIKESSLILVAATDCHLYAFNRQNPSQKFNATLDHCHPYQNSKLHTNVFELKGDILVTCHAQMSRRPRCGVDCPPSETFVTVWTIKRHHFERVKLQRFNTRYVTMDFIPGKCIAYVDNTRQFLRMSGDIVIYPWMSNQPQVTLHQHDNTSVLLNPRVYDFKFKENQLLTLSEDDKITIWTLSDNLSISLIRTLTISGSAYQISKMTNLSPKGNFMVHSINDLIGKQTAVVYNMKLIMNGDDKDCIMRE